MLSAPCAQSFGVLIASGPERCCMLRPTCSALHSICRSGFELHTSLDAACSGSSQTKQTALPPDASCEDLQIEATLPFLNAFVQQALENGAAPYISQQQRSSMGVMPTSRHHEVAEQPHALRFAAYETAKAPGAAASHNLLDSSSPGQRSRSNSPVKGQLPHSPQATL